MSFSRTITSKVIKTSEPIILDDASSAIEFKDEKKRTISETAMKLLTAFSW